jgi:hypothetical protein
MIKMISVIATLGHRLIATESDRVEVFKNDELTVTLLDRKPVAL